MREHGDAEEPEALAGPGEPGGAAFGAALRGHRRAAGLTQEALAERAGVGVRTLQGLEAGTSAPLRATARRLADGLGLPEAARARFLAAATPPLRAPRAPAGPRGGLRLVPPPPARPDPAPPGNLPAELSSFVGREREVAAVGAALAAHRLVTLTGPGGVGKTRLALRVAAELPARLPGGRLARGAGRRWPTPPWCPGRSPRPPACGRSPAARCSPPSPTPCGRGACCWCWTTASTCWTPAPGWPTPCCGPART